MKSLTQGLPNQGHSFIQSRKVLVGKSMLSQWELWVRSFVIQPLQFNNVPKYFIKSFQTPLLSLFLKFEYELSFYFQSSARKACGFVSKYFHESVLFWIYNFKMGLHCHGNYGIHQFTISIHYDFKQKGRCFLDYAWKRLGNPSLGNSFGVQCLFW